MRVDRRVFTVGGLAALAAPTSAQGRDSVQRMAGIEADLGGRIGVAAIDTAPEGRSFVYRGDERFAMCSTFKLLLACAAMQRVDRGEDYLFTPLRFTQADILAYAPVAQAKAAAGVMSIEEACAAVVEVSDNTAANLLLARMGGPAAFTRWLRGAGDMITRLDRNEPGLNENARADLRDTTTPLAMAQSMRRVLLTDSDLTAASRARVWGWMQASRTGLQRIRAALPAIWTVGDKTGTGNGAVNDIAIAYPNGAAAPWVIACYVDAPGTEVSVCERALRRASSAAAVALGQAPSIVSAP